MTREVVTVTPSTSLTEAVELLRSHTIRHLPVIDDGRVVGILTDRDLRFAMGAGASSDEAAAADVMNAPAITVPPETPVESAARTLIEHRIGCLPVVEDGALVGILTESDLLRSFVDLMVGRQRHSRLEILAPDRPGELARIVRLVGIDHGINITGVVVPPFGGERALIVLHLESDEVSALVAHLRRLGYEADAPSLPNRPE